MIAKGMVGIIDNAEGGVDVDGRRGGGSQDHNEGRKDGNEDRDSGALAGGNNKRRW